MSHIATPNQNQGQNSNSKKQEKNEITEIIEETQRKGYWITTLPSGERLAVNSADGSAVPVKHALISETCDPATKQVELCSFKFFWNIMM